MKKFAILIFAIITLTGCTAVRINTTSIDNIINVVLSKNNKLYNRVGKGYKYYIPRGVNYIDTDELNDKLYSDGNYYYLYIDAISYYYNIQNEYTENKYAYYSKIIDINGKNGYLEITKTNSNKYLIEYDYNFARIEAIVEKDDINEVVLNATYILSTIKFNNNIIKLMLDDEFFINKEEKYDKFESKDEFNTFIEVKDIENEENSEINE